MAYIPDDAIDNFSELSKGARLLYVYLARCRNQKNGKCCPSVSTTMGALGVNKGTIYALRAELEDKEWATFDGNNALNLYGFQSLKNQTTLVPMKEDSEEKGESEQKSEKSDFQSEKSDQLVRLIRPIGLINRTKQSEKSDSLIMKNQQREPAKEPVSGARASSEPKPSTEYQAFCAIHLQRRGVPYVNKSADFVQLANLKKKLTAQGWELTPDRWQSALENYFASEIVSFTLADLAVRFTTFFAAKVDRFNRAVSIQPVSHNSGGQRKVVF